MKVLRLTCPAPCGRNLADVTYPTYREHPTNPSWTRDGLQVSRRPNVDQEDYRPWHVAHNPGAQRPRDDDNWDWHDRTYIWRCKCGQKHERRHETISAAWQRHADDSQRVVRLTIGVDV